MRRRIRAVPLSKLLGLDEDEYRRELGELNNDNGDDSNSNRRRNGTKGEEKTKKETTERKKEEEAMLLDSLLGDGSRRRRRRLDIRIDFRIDSCTQYLGSSTYIQTKMFFLHVIRTREL